jgi:hypothetical protein
MTSFARLMACCLLAFWCTCPLRAADKPDPIPWKTQWNQALFAQAAREHRFVLLDLHAVPSSTIRHPGSVQAAAPRAFSNNAVLSAVQRAAVERFSRWLH